MSDEILRTLSPIAEWQEQRLGDLELTDAKDPLLPTPFRIAEASSAALGAVGLAVSDIWETRTGRSQKVAVDVRRATASLRSGRYMKFEEDHVSTERNPVMGVLPGQERSLELPALQFPEPPRRRTEGPRRSRRQGGGAASGGRLGRPGAGGGNHRGERRRWHGAGPWTNGPNTPRPPPLPHFPCWRLSRSGTVPPEPLPAGDRPLSGVRVLDLTRVLAGPTCARTLAEHGADVLKITGPHLPSIGYQEYDTGHGKLSAHLDLREQSDLDTLLGLVSQADVFSQGYRPGTLGSRGLSPEELAELRPGIVYVSLSAFGHVGPWASRRGFDTVIQTVSGITSRQGDLFPGAEPGPQFYPVSAIDYLTGYLMAFGALVALGRRAREGGSWLVRISLAQTGRWLVGLGQVPESDLQGVASDFTAAELEGWSLTSETQGGRLHHLGPVVQLSETPPHWARPAVPLGFHQPVWPDRTG